MSEVYGTEILRAMEMLHFVPALIYVEKVSEKEYFSPRNMIARFGHYLDKKENSEDHVRAFVDFYDWNRDIGRKLSDWKNISPIWLTQPDLSREIRTLQEWNKKPWPKEVYVDSKQMDMQGYLSWEEKRQSYYYNEAKKFLYGE